MLLDRAVLFERLPNVEVLDDNLLVVLVVGLVEEYFLVDDDDFDKLLLVFKVLVDPLVKLIEGLKLLIVVRCVLLDVVLVEGERLFCVVEMSREDVGVIDLKVTVDFPVNFRDVLVPVCLVEPVPLLTWLLETELFEEDRAAVLLVVV